jgi:alpha-amylase
MNSKTLLFITLLVGGCSQPVPQEAGTVINISSAAPFIWDNANVYFLLTDRFVNGDTTNDHAYGRQQDGVAHRSFYGGDLRGVIQKIEAGYFTNLGITALWLTPPIENIHGATDEGTGKTYAYHGYWPRDWTTIDANLGSMEDYRELVEKAHQRGIRVLMDVIINHTGPVTDIDSQWPDEWVRMSPTCTFDNFKNNIECTLVNNLPDIRTERNEPVDLPPFLVKKWQQEGRFEQEIKELDEFFARTGYPRAPRFYIIKWLTDYVRELGIDGFRVDTAKHTEPSVWAELFKEAALALEEWRNNHPDKKLDDLPFYMVGEVYGYAIQNGLNYDMGDTTINFYENGLQALINFAIKGDANNREEEIFALYSSILHEGDLKGYSTLNYLASHDDGGPFDLERKRVIEAGTKLLLAPGASQVYYGDETARPLNVKANGDASLRSPMNWRDLEANTNTNGFFTSDIYRHWSKLGRFRKAHPAVGAGLHTKLATDPYTFKRVLDHSDLQDKVVVVLGKINGAIDVSEVFADQTGLTDYYSGKTAVVVDGKVTFETDFNYLLLGEQ